MVSEQRKGLEETDDAKMAEIRRDDSFPMTREDASRESSVFRRRLQFPRRRMLVPILLVAFLGALAWDRIAREDLPSSRRLSSTQPPVSTPTRILYILTTLAEYNNGSRSTVKGSDRLQETLIPVLVEGVESMLSFGYEVDVYLICHFDMKPDRLQLIRSHLPKSVRLDVWDNATPLGYKLEEKELKKIDYVTRGLARQHRFVIKDRLLDYDVFVNFEDDMLVKGDHVQNYVDIVQELHRLRKDAPDNLPTAYEHLPKIKLERHYHGPLTKTQLSRMFPGFMRVEVLLEEETYGAQPKLDAVPVDLENGTLSVDPQPCCHVSNRTSNDHIPMTPTSDKLILWETGIEALGVREMPVNSTLGWVLMLRGPNYGKSDRDKVIGDYWSRRMLPDNKEHRPQPNLGGYINNQGGWMATRQQIWEWHTEICPGGFLPPYDEPHFKRDGLDLRNVEYWSGGLSLYTWLNACNMQRIVSLDPAQFSRQLLYHTANNKQRQLHSQQNRFVKLENLLGQLNSVRRHAQQEIPSPK